MKLAPRFAVTIVLLTAAVGCNKAAATDSTSTTGADVGAACATRLASLNGKATEAEKKAYTAACAAVSPTTRQCLAAVKQSSDLDACVKDPGEKEKLFGILLGADAEQSRANATAVHPTKLDKLGGITMDAPGMATVSDGIDKQSVTVLDNAFGALSVHPAKASSAKTLKAAKAEAGSLRGKNVKGETTPDGYWLTFETGGTYWVKVRHQLGKTSYECEATSTGADESAAALKACQSLRL